MKSAVKSSWMIVALVTVTMMTGSGWGQFTQDEPLKIEIREYPPEIQRDFKVYKAKCSTCHELGGVTRKLRAVPAQQEFWVKKMQAMPSTSISGQDAKQVLAFLSHDASHHASQPQANVAPVDPKTAESIAAGLKFYKDQNCNACHTIDGEGGTGGPALDNIGRMSTREKLVARMKVLRSNADSSMPPLPPDTNDEQINSLVEYLLTLKPRTM